MDPKGEINPPASPTPPEKKAIWGASLSGEELIALNEEIAGMARAGFPLDKGLAAMARDMGYGRLKKITSVLADDLQSGLTLPQALAKQGQRVPPYAALVSAGVRTGKLHEVLAVLSQYARSMTDLRQVIFGAMVYPLMVIILSLSMIGFLIVYLVPEFENLYADFRLKLPNLTEGLIQISKQPIHNLVVPVAGLVLGMGAVKIVLGRTPWGQRSWARFVYSIPLFGTLIRSSRLAAFTELLAIMVDHEVPLAEAFRLAGAASHDPIMASAAKGVYQDLAEGQPLGIVMHRHHLVPELVAWMTSLGERRGTLGPTLHQASQLYKRQAEMRAALLRSAFPGFLILITALLMSGLFVIILILPLFYLIQNISGF
jgi:type II secretory pathway component PulF